MITFFCFSLSFILLWLGFFECRVVGMDGSNSNDSVIVVNNLSYRYPDGTQALKSVSFEVRAGECLGIVGGNGAGKSTLLLHLNGILVGDGGDIFIFGMRVERKNLKTIRQKLGLVFQNPEDQLFSATLYDDIAFGPRNMGIEGDELERVVDETLRYFKLEGYRNKNPYHLSFGEKKIAAIATIYSMRPEIYCFDEPTSNLDPRSREEIVDILGRIDKTRLIITHDIELVKQLCERVMVLNRGVVERIGSVKEVFSDRELLFRARLA